MATISDGLSAYRICAKAEGKSPKTITWIMSSVGYFMDYLGPERQELSGITGNDLRGFIVALQQSPKYRHHPYNKVKQEKISSQSIETYARAVRAFFGFLEREEFIDVSPMAKIKMPKVPKKVITTFSGKEIENLLSQPDKQTAVGFRDFALMLVFVDTTARLSEIANLNLGDVDLDNGYLKVMGKGAKERLVPIGQKLAKALLKYKLKFRPEAIGNEHFWLTADSRTLEGGRIEKIVAAYGKKAGLKRCHPHRLRHTSSVLYLRNGGDPFSLQKKLGHSSLTMTRHYCNLADADVRAQHLRYGVADRLNI